MKERILLQLEEDTRAFERSQEQTLLKILQDNKDTEYGRNYGFADIHSAQDYKKKVPITTYEDYRDYIGRMLEGGEERLTTAYPVRYYTVSSGTTGKKKYIPMTEIGIDVYGKYAYACAKEAVQHYYRQLGSELNSMECVGRIFLLNEIRCSRLEHGQRSLIASSAVFQRRLEQGTFDFWRYTSPKPVLFPECQMDMNYLKLRYALADPDVTAIEGAFVHQVLNIFYYLEHNWKVLTEDIAAGTIHKDIDIPDAVRKQLEPALIPMPERARQLREIFEQGFDSPVAGRIWKKLKFIMAINGAVFQTYMDKLLPYIGGIPFHYMGYGASEGAFAPVIDVGWPGAYVFAPELGFFEFLPVDMGDTLETCEIRSLQAGKKYEMVHTGYAGLYRYRMGDVLEVAGFYQNAPVMKFCYRRGYCVNVAGEKMDLEKMAGAVDAFADACQMQAGNFCVYEDREVIPARYVVLLEMPDAGLSGGFGLSDGRKAPGGTELPGSLGLRTSMELAGIMDACLRRQNMDYDDCRNLKEIGSPRVCFVRAGAWERYKQLLQSRGIDVGQHKPVRLLDTEEKKEFFFREIV